MFYGVNALIIRMSVAISAGTISLVQTVTSYRPVTDPTLMAPAAVVGFRLLVSVVPAVLIGLGLIFVFLYPLYGARLAAVKRMCTAARSAVSDKTAVPEPEVLTS
jgi:Na+/melibiose symporter-like transporter